MSKQKDNLETIELTEQNIESLVYTIRGVKVMLDFDLARIYGYETKRFNEQVKNNIDKFPEDFMFKLTSKEVNEILMSQIVTSSESEILKSKKSATKELNADTLRSKILTSNETEILKSKKSASSWGGRRKLPYAYTEQGIYHSGPSSKNAGHKISTITKIDEMKAYRPLINDLLRNIR